MNYLFPKLEQSDQKTLFIIGNGFDLSHGIKSSYSDFKEWLVDNEYSKLIELMDIFFSNNGDVWGNIEKALGEYDEKQILEYCKPDEEIDYEHITRSIAAIEDSPDYLFIPTPSEFIEAFRKWVFNIDISNVEQKNELPTQSLYLTFNYTEILEDIYKISDSQILHIHGSRQNEDDEIVVGHNKRRNNIEAYSDESELLYKEEAYCKIITCMNKFVKNTQGILDQNQNFLNRLSNIDLIMVYGHSFYEVDYPYLEEVINKTAQTAIWRISYHNDDDAQRIKSFFREKGITNFSLFYM